MRQIEVSELWVQEEVKNSDITMKKVSATPAANARDTVRAGWRWDTS